VDPGTTYLIRQPTAHPIHENWRVELFRQLLTLPNLGPEQVKLLGEIMYQVAVSSSYASLALLMRTQVLGSLQACPEMQPEGSKAS